MDYQTRENPLVHKGLNPVFETADPKAGIIEYFKEGKNHFQNAGYLHEPFTNKQVISLANLGIENL